MPNSVEIRLCVLEFTLDSAPGMSRLDGLPRLIQDVVELSMPMDLQVCLPAYWTSRLLLTETVRGGVGMGVPALLLLRQLQSRLGSDLVTIRTFSTTACGFPD